MDILTPLLGIIAAGIALTVLYAFLFRKDTNITPDQIPIVLSKLQSYGKEGAYALFTFQPPDSGGEVTFQFSIQGNTVGLDWYRSFKRRGEVEYVRNEEDLPRFVEFARTLGYEVTDKPAANQYSYSYVRVERGGSLAELATKLVRELYPLGAEAPIKLEVDGFEWK